MAKASIRKPARVSADEAPLSSNPFGALASRLLDAPAGPAEATPPTPSEPGRPETSSDPAALRGRLIVRRQKRGQGGKTVTCVEGLPSAALHDLVVRLKRDLGCSARLDGEVLVAGTGEHARVAQWLRQAGASSVALGN